MRLRRRPGASSSLGRNSQSLGYRSVDLLEDAFASLGIREVRISRIDARHDLGVDAREQRPQSVLNHDAVLARGSRGNAQRDLPGERALLKEIEEDLEQSRIGRAVDGRARDEDCRALDLREGLLHACIRSSAEERIGGELGEGDQCGLYVVFTKTTEGMVEQAARSGLLRGTSRDPNGSHALFVHEGRGEGDWNTLGTDATLGVE